MDNRNFENIQNLINSAKTAKESYFKKNDLDTKHIRIVKRLEKVLTF